MVQSIPVVLQGEKSVSKEEQGLVELITCDCGIFKTWRTILTGGGSSKKPRLEEIKGKRYVNV